jgi:hypothetical protein
VVLAGTPASTFTARASQGEQEATIPLSAALTRADSTRASPAHAGGVVQLRGRHLDSASSSSSSFADPASREFHAFVASDRNGDAAAGKSPGWGMGVVAASLALAVDGIQHPHERRISLGGISAQRYGLSAALAQAGRYQVNDFIDAEHRLVKLAMSVFGAHCGAEGVNPYSLTPARLLLEMKSTIDAINARSEELTQQRLMQAMKTDFDTLDSNASWPTNLSPIRLTRCTGLDSQSGISGPHRSSKPRWTCGCQS